MNKEFFEKYAFILLYQGSFKNAPTYSLSAIVENSLMKFYSKKIAKKLVYLIIEMVQNIERYSEHDDNQDDLTLIYTDRKTFYVITENTINQKALNGLKKRLSNIQDKHKSELDLIFRETLNNEEGTEKGAGLGLIDIARKTQNSLRHKFIDIGDEKHKFQFSISIPIDPEQKSVSFDPEIIPSDIIELYANSKSSIVYSGDFSNNFLVLLIDMLNDVKKGEESDDTIFRHSLIEMVQNIKRHAVQIKEEKPGFIQLDWLEGKMRLTGSNLVANEKAEAIKLYLDILNNSSVQDLEALSEEKMLDFDSEGGLGLIHLSSLIKPAKLFYEFSPFDDEHQVYLLQAIFKDANS